MALADPRALRMRARRGSAAADEPDADRPAFLSVADALEGDVHARAASLGELAVHEALAVDPDPACFGLDHAEALLVVEPHHRAVHATSSRRECAGGAEARPRTSPTRAKRSGWTFRASGPFAPSAPSNSTFAPSASVLKPSPTIARVVDEHVLATLVRGDEAVALRVVEPLHGSSCHRCTPPLPIKNKQR